MGENRPKSLESLLEDVDVIAGSLELNLPFVGRGHVKPGETETVAQVKLRRHQVRRGRLGRQSGTGCVQSNGSREEGYSEHQGARR